MIVPVDAFFSSLDEFSNRFSRMMMASKRIGVPLDKIGTIDFIGCYDNILDQVYVKRLEEKASSGKHYFLKIQKI